ncbi:MAG: XylR N-terminal domain-containing protein [Deltaproteobacteria bacterium]|nr:XylR N-terminal domain-containing protein [Deltaproteobacteria bacterium]
MKATDLKMGDLFEFVPAQGVIKFREGRVLMIDAEAIGRMRELLIKNIGHEAARAILSQYGYTNGYYDALKLQNLYRWDTEIDWLAAGPVMHTLEGIVQVEPREISVDRAKKTINMHGVWRNSYEAEQHLATFGKAETAVCWTQTSYASGYATAFMGCDCICIEEKCVARGDPECYWHIRRKEDWGAEAAPYVRALALLTSDKEEFRRVLGAGTKAE